MDRGQGHWDLAVCLLEEGREGWVEAEEQRQEEEEEEEEQ